MSTAVFVLIPQVHTSVIVRRDSKAVDAKSTLMSARLAHARMKEPVLMNAVVSVAFVCQVRSQPAFN